MSQIYTEPVGGLGDAREGGEDEVIELSRIGLCGYWVGFQAQLLHHSFLQVAGCSPLSKEPLVACGGSHSSFNAFPLHKVSEKVLDIEYIHYEVLGVVCESIAHGGWLGGLEVGPAHADQISVFHHVLDGGVKAVNQSCQDEVERRLHPEDVGVIQNIHRCRPEMDLSTAKGALFGVGSDLGHDVVSDLPLDLLGPLQVYVLGAHLRF